MKALILATLVILLLSMLPAAAATPEEGSAIVIGTPITDDWGVCVVVDPESSGLVFVDAAHDCDQDP